MRSPARPVLIAALLALALFTSPGVRAGQDQWSGVARVVAFADVHGAFNEMQGLLREAGVTDSQDHWAAGSAHVVSLGDLLDRGADSRKVMDLLMRLQTEAQASGGALHVVLGNHEAMNLLGDLRYVEKGEYAAYADLESAADRQAALTAWRARQATPCAEPCAAFEEKFPPGYFGHRVAFQPGGRYGAWLLAQPVAVRINDTLFMHAGLGPVVRNMDLMQLNLRYRTAVTEYLGMAAQLTEARLLLPEDPYEDRPRLARDRLAALGTPDAAREETVKRFESAANHPLLSEEGPNWYRGDALCNEVSETDVLLPLLQQFGVARLVVGHTPTRDARVATRFGGKLVKLDTGMNRAAYRGRPAALTIAGDTLSVRYAGEAEARPPSPEGLFVAPSQLDDASVLAALRDGTIAVTGPAGPDAFNVAVSHDGRRLPAVFLVRAEDAVRRELAAQALDRLLGLGFVPATAARTHEGQKGLLQARPQRWLTQDAVQKQGVRGGGWCAAEPQFQLMYGFDVLSGNEARTADSILIDTADWYIYGSSFARAFGTGSGLPAYLRARPPAVGAELRRRAGALDDATLEKTLGEYLDTRQRRAILQRRDALLALPAAAPAAR